MRFNPLVVPSNHLEETAYIYCREELSDSEEQFQCFKWMFSSELAEKALSSMLTFDFVIPECVKDYKADDPKNSMLQEGEIAQEGVLDISKTRHSGRELLSYLILSYSEYHIKTEMYEGTFQGRVSVVITEQIHDSFTKANQAMSQIQLEHPYICKTYDCFLEETETKQIKSVLVVELMKQDVMKEIEERKTKACPWSDAELMQHLGCLVSALGYAESKGVCHRRIMPHNLFVSWDGQTIKIGDFGDYERYVMEQRFAGIVGTPFFFSPERRKYEMYMMVNPEQLPYDPVKSDVYSLGVTLLCMATLDFPHQLLNFSALESGTNEVLGSLHSFPYLQQYLRWMLAIRNEDRPTFVQMEAQLQPVQSLSILEEQKNRSDQQVESTPEQVSKAPVEPSEPVKTNISRKEIPACAYCGKSLQARFATFCTTVPLDCGHSFHSPDCFKEFYQRTITECDPPTFKCPRCAEVIPLATIGHVIEAKELNRMALDLLKVCGRCGLKSRVKELNCAFCEDCYSEIRRGAKCPICDPPIKGSIYG